LKQSTLEETNYEVCVFELMKEIRAVAWPRGFWWVYPPNKAPKSHKWKYETLQISGVLLLWECPGPPAQT